MNVAINPEWSANRLWTIDLVIWNEAKRKPMYFVMCLTCDVEHCSWELGANIANCTRRVQSYWNYITSIHDLWGKDTLFSYKYCFLRVLILIQTCICPDVILFSFMNIFLFLEHVGIDSGYLWFPMRPSLGPGRFVEISWWHCIFFRYGIGVTTSSGPAQIPGPGWNLMLVMNEWVNVCMNRWMIEWMNEWETCDWETVTILIRFEK
jgi:hypothetical protein